MTNLETSIEEIKIIESLNLNLRDSCIIYHFKKIADEEIFQKIKGVTIDLESYLSFDSLLKDFKMTIITGTRYFVQLWGLLEDNSPDLSRMKEIAFKIQRIDEQISQKYAKLKKINPQSYKIAKLYSDYVLDVLNDPRYAKEVIE